MIEVGMKFRQTRPVTPEVTAQSFGTDMMPVLATPWLVALLEDTAAKCVEGELDASQITLGIAVNIKHLAATPAGLNVTCEAVLTGIDRRKLTFETHAWDECGLVSEGTQERFIVDREAFLAKINEKLTEKKSL